MGFFRQEYWSVLPCLSPVDLPDPGMEPRSPALQGDSLPAEPQGKPMHVRVNEYKNWAFLFKCLICRNSAQEWALEGVGNVVKVEVALD